MTHTVVDGVTVLQSPCFNYETPAGDYVMFGAAAAAGAWAVDWLRRDRVTVFRVGDARARSPSIGPILARRATGLQMSLSF